jgi:nucleotide-binding universal stress UspA family protein
VILICYDGSPDSRAAIERAGELLGGRAAILTVWEPIVEVMARTGAARFAVAVDVEKIDSDTEQEARERAEEGVEHARKAGFDPEPRVRPVDTTIAQAILSEANDVDASVVVLGTRGLTGLKSLLLGSVSHAVLQHADRPVMVVPSPDVAAGRAAQQG